MAFYRHFVERNDFEIKVVTNCENFPKGSVPYEPILFCNTALTRRLFRTRLMPWLYGPHSLTAFGRVPGVVWRVAKEFQPDAVFTIAGSWDWSALVAQRVARRLNVPLIASFNDWFNYGWFPSHSVYHRMIEQRFRRFYKEADLVLCTCEGMYEAFGPHSNAHILYPIGARMSETLSSYQPFIEGAHPFIVGFGGSLADWYGPMLERLVSTAEAERAPIEFRLYGSNPTWSREFDAYARNRQIYRGHLPFAQLRVVMKEVDALILPMGFEKRASVTERTSFKTKFLDYLSYKKPIFVWGPEYCSAVRVAREFDSAEICISPEVDRCLKILLLLAKNPQRQILLVDNARRMYEDRFHPDKIHAGLARAIARTIHKVNKR